MSLSPSGQPDPAATRSFGRDVDFGRAAVDYRTHRAGFPDGFFHYLAQHGWAIPGQRALDLGTGTGTVARGLARLGMSVEALDPSKALLDVARVMDASVGVNVVYRVGQAEAPGGNEESLDLVTAGQCWHWFDRPQAACEAFRLLRDGGRIVIAHFDWLPLAGNVVAATEALILQYNPAWTMSGGTGVYPDWFCDLSEAGFTGLESFSFDHPQPYSAQAWRGRIRASAAIKASLSADAVARFDAELGEILDRDFPGDPLIVPHRVWAVSGTKPIRR